MPLQNKNTVYIVSFAIIAAAVALSFVMPEKRFFHIPVFLLLIPVILLSAYLSFKDILLLTVAAFSVLFSLIYFGVIKMAPQLLAETAVLTAVILVLGFREDEYSAKKAENRAVLEFKKKEVLEAKQRLIEAERENHRIIEETKALRKKFLV